MYVCMYVCSSLVPHMDTGISIVCMGCIVDKNAPKFVMHNCTFIMAMNDIISPPLFPAGMPE